MNFTPEDEWWMQRKTAECAKKLSFNACLMTDEQGGVLFVDIMAVPIRKKKKRTDWNKLRKTISIPD